MMRARTSVSDLSVWLEEERLPEGWEPAVRSPFGYTIGDLHLRAAQVNHFVSDLPSSRLTDL